MADDDFNFEDVFPFHRLPPELGTVLMGSLVTISKTWHMVYEEHINNGFDQQQALQLTLSLQRDVFRTVAAIGGELMRVLPDLMEKGKDDG